MDLTPQDIQDKEFHDAFRGYSHEEVDLFLDDVAGAFERVYKENQEFHHRLRELEAQLTQARATEDMLKRTLLAAQKTADEAIEEARGKGRELVREAESKAREIVAAAERRAQEIVDAALAREREAEARLEELRGFEAEQRARLHAHVESLGAQLRMLETDPRAEAVAPHGAPEAAPAPRAPAEATDASETRADASGGETPRPAQVIVAEAVEGGLPPAPAEATLHVAAEDRPPIALPGEEGEAEERPVEELFWGEE